MIPKLAVSITAASSVINTMRVKRVHEIRLCLIVIILLLSLLYARFLTRLSLRLLVDIQFAHMIVDIEAAGFPLE